MSFSGKPELTDLDPISNEPFWCELSIVDLMDNYRIPAEYDNGVIMQGLLMAAVRVNARLNPVKEAILALAPTSNFEDYVTEHPNDTVNNIDFAIHEYLNAVYCKAKARLLQNFNTLNRRKDAENDAKEAPETAQYWENEAQQSIFNLLNLYAPESALSANHDTFIGLL